MKKQQMQSYQHEPLLTPQGWQGEEKRFAIRLAQLIEQLFQTQQGMLRRLKQLEEENHAQV